MKTWLISWLIPNPSFIFFFRLLLDKLRGCVAKRKPPTSPRIRRTRMRWSRFVQQWTTQRNWRRVVFSDEFHATIGKCNGRVFVRRGPHERYSPVCLQHGSNVSRQSVMFWGCIGYGVLGHLVEVNGRMNQDDYVGILSQHLPPSAQDIFGQAQPNFVFQQDNAPPHTGRRAANWISNQPFQCMEWPPYSPDMNLIESVWGWILRKLNADPPSTLDQLRQRIQQHWGEVTPQELRRLYHQMPRRVQLLRRVRGYPTKYWCREYY